MIKTKDYSAYVVDVDGTLYYQRWMQIQMALYLLSYYLFRPYRIKEILILYSYRKLRNGNTFAEESNHEQIIIQKLARAYHRSEAQIQEIVHEWILTRPLQILYSARDQHLIAFLQKQVHDGNKVYIYSDYPAIQKCDVLGISANDIYWPDTTRISVLKPSSKGLEYILQSNHLSPSDVLFIGDRMEKDGLCAQGASVDCLILRRNRFSRWIQYKYILNKGVLNL